MALASTSPPSVSKSLVPALKSPPSVTKSLPGTTCLVPNKSQLLAEPHCLLQGDSPVPVDVRIEPDSIFSGACKPYRSGSVSLPEALRSTKRALFDALDAARNEEQPAAAVDKSMPSTSSWMTSADVGTLASSCRGLKSPPSRSPGLKRLALQEALVSSLDEDAEDDLLLLRAKSWCDSQTEAESVARRLAPHESPNTPCSGESMLQASPCFCQDVEQAPLDASRIGLVPPLPLQQQRAAPHPASAPVGITPTFASSTRTLLEVSPARSDLEAALESISSPPRSSRCVVVQQPDYSRPAQRLGATQRSSSAASLRATPQRASRRGHCYLEDVQSASHSGALSLATSRTLPPEDVVDLTPDATTNPRPRHEKPASLLAAARDHFKQSVGASARAKEFRSVFLRELHSITSTPEQEQTRC